MSRILTRFVRLATLVLVVALLTTACASATPSTQTTTQTSSAAATATATTKTPATTSNSSSTGATSASGNPAIRVAALKGPTGIGMVSLMEESAQKKTADNYQFTLSAAPDDLVAKLSSGEVDIAALPTNLAASLYQKTNGRIKLLAINTLGVLYVLENGNTVQSVADLKGKALAASGQGATPEFALNAILGQAALTPAPTVTWLQEHAELATQAIAGKFNLVMLPEPFVTTVLAKAPQFRIAIDLTKAFAVATQKSASDKSELAMGCLAVRADFAEKNTEAIKRFLTAYEASTKWVNANVDQAGVLVAKYTIMADAKTAAKSIPTCNITFVAGKDMKPMIEPLFSILYKAEPKSIGGKMPDDAFYYIP